MVLADDIVLSWHEPSFIPLQGSGFFIFLGGSWRETFCLMNVFRKDIKQAKVSSQLKGIKFVMQRNYYILLRINSGFGRKPTVLHYNSKLIFHLENFFESKLVEQGHIIQFFSKHCSVVSIFYWSYFTFSIIQHHTLQISIYQYSSLHVLGFVLTISHHIKNKIRSGSSAVETTRHCLVKTSTNWLYSQGSRN